MDTSFERADESTQRAAHLRATSPFDDIDAAIERYENSNSTAVGVNVSNKSNNETNILNQVNASGIATPQPIVPIFVPTYRNPNPPPPPPLYYTYPYVVPYPVSQPKSETTSAPSKPSTDLSDLVKPPTGAPSSSSSGISPTVLSVGCGLVLAVGLVGYYVYRQKRS
jgi:hypothetical protein